MDEFEEKKSKLRDIKSSYIIKRVFSFYRKKTKIKYDNL